MKNKDFSISTQRPNIVIILADDMGYGDPGCYNDQSKIPTPYMDQLAKEGRLFTDAHAPASICTPTRYGLLTGRYCWRTPLQRSALWSWDPPLIEANRLTLPKMLQQNGYHTAAIGKWHLGWDWPLKGEQYITDEFTGHTLPETTRLKYGRQIDFQKAIRSGPIEKGFDYFFGLDTPNGPPYCFIENDHTVGIPYVWKEKGMFGVLTTEHSAESAQHERAHPGPAVPAWDLSLITPVITQKAVQYIGKQTDEQPFMLYLPMPIPHTPIAPTPHFIGKSKAGWYGDFVHQLDWCVGQVRAALAHKGLEENTLLIVTSDNGPAHRDGTNMSGAVGSLANYNHNPSRPWRGVKSDIWEAGHRVPFIASWPNHIPANTVSHELISLTDLMRTIAKIIDYEIPEHAGEDSFDIGAALFDKAVEPVRDHLISHSLTGMFAIRQNEWKLILGQGSGGGLHTDKNILEDDAPWQLYNMKDDPEEQHNLYYQHPEIAEKLSQFLVDIKQKGRSYFN